MPALGESTPYFFNVVSLYSKLKILLLGSVRQRVFNDSPLKTIHSGERGAASKGGFWTVGGERYWKVNTQVSTKAIRTKGSITFQRAKAEKYYPSTVCTYHVKSNRSFILLSSSFEKKKTSEYIVTNIPIDLFFNDME